MLSRWSMQSERNVPLQVLQDLEPDPGTADFAIRPLESLSPSILHPALTPHRHDFYEIVWITEGQGTLSIDLDHYPIQPNTLCLLAPGQIHTWQVEQTPVGFVLGFTHRFFAESPKDSSALIELPFFQDVGAAPVLSADEEQAELFSQTCTQLLRESQRPLPGQATLLRSYLRILLIEARRLQEAGPDTIHPAEARFALTRQFMLLVEQHYLETCSVADYAALLHVTANHLVETVKATLGQPAGKIIRERLLLEAKRLLRYTDLSVAEIATGLNFEDPSYFSRFFKDRTGLSPSEFRTRRQFEGKWEPAPDLARPGVVLRLSDFIPSRPALAPMGVAA